MKNGRKHGAKSCVAKRYTRVCPKFCQNHIISNRHMTHAIPNYHAWVVSVIQYSVIHKWVSNGLPRCVPAWIALASAAGPWQLPTLEAVTSAQTGPIDKMPTNSNKFHTILAISTGFQSHALPSNSSSGRRFDGPISIFWGILESLAARAAGLFKDSFSSRSFCT